MDIIERLWIAHSELPGRQLLMRAAIEQIEALRAEVLHLENRCRSYADIALENKELREAIQVEQRIADHVLSQTHDQSAGLAAFLSSPPSKKEGEQ